MSKGIMRPSTLILLLFFSSPSFSLVGVGGYIPFGFSTQKDPDGGDNKFTFHPMISVNTVYQLNFYRQLALPEFGIAFHRDTYDDIRKRTFFVLWDLGMSITPKVLVRYGLGTFLTRVSSDGGTIELPNGDSTISFAKPSESSTSWNTTLNLGTDLAVQKNLAMKFETFIFGLFGSDSRAISYSLSLNYYLN